MELRCAYSHLFRGCRLDGDPTSGPVRVAFPDGTSAEAELLEGGPLGSELALAMPAHRTAAGTRIPPRVWIVRQDGAGLVIGDRLRERPGAGGSVPGPAVPERRAG